MTSWKCSSSSATTPQRIQSGAALAQLWGAYAIPASSGTTAARRRLYTGGRRHPNAGLHRSVIVRVRFHQPTIAYVNRRSADRLGTNEIIRCLKRFVAREIYQAILPDHQPYKPSDRPHERAS